MVRGHTQAREPNPEKCSTKKGIAISSGEAARASSHDRLTEYATTDKPAKLTRSRQISSRFAKWSIRHYIVETSSPTEALIAVRKSMKAWSYVALALVGIGILVNLKDIKRYIRISTM